MAHQLILKPRFGTPSRALIADTQEAVPAAAWRAQPSGR
jgi:hypothetical protein